MVPAEQTTALVAKCQNTARPGSKSPLGGLTAFPPHTDGASKRKPPLLVMLRCLTAPSGCPTYLLSRHAIELEDSLRIGLSVGLWVCRGMRRPHLSPVLDVTGHREGALPDVPHPVSWPHRSPRALNGECDRQSRRQTRPPLAAPPIRAASAEMVPRQPHTRPTSVQNLV